MEIRNIAHRGFSTKYPENTMLAFQKALEAGCNGIENDVHLTRDGQLVVIHDEDIARTTNGKGAVKDFTFEEIRKFDASAGFAGMYGFNPIPTLQEYFELVKDRDVFTNLELKNSNYDYPGLEQAVIDLVREYGLEEQVVLSSFNHHSILRCKRIAPEIPCGFLYMSWMIDGGNYAKMHGVEFLNPKFVGINEVTVEEINRAGVDIIAWTIDDEQEARRMLNLGIKYIISNCPDMIRKAIDDYLLAK